MSEIKGYLVRGKDKRGNPLESNMLATIGAAVNARRVVVEDPYREATIFSVSPDGTETPLPTYEEALNALAMARDATEMALRAHGARGMGGAPSELEGCPPGALRALLRLLGGGR